MIKSLVPFHLFNFLLIFVFLRVPKLTSMSGI